MSKKKKKSNHKKTNIKKKNNRKTTSSSKRKTSKQKKNTKDLYYTYEPIETKETQDEIIEDDVLINKPVDKDNKHKKPIKLLIIILIGILIVELLTREEKIIKNVQFSSNLDNYQFQLLDIDKDSTEENWISIYGTTIQEDPYKNTKIEIRNIDTDSIIEIDRNDYYFNYYGEESIVLPIDSTYKIDYLFYSPNELSQLVFMTSNDNAYMEGNELIPISSGDITIYATFDEEEIPILNILISDLIVPRPKEFDETKEFLTCEQYSDEDNKELDLVLEKKIDLVGYKTRAGAVEALRFLTLDFPYRVDYFYENGRLPNLDAQGRYYHKGLYLSKHKYDELSNPKNSNKGTWGCKIYSYPADEKESNGLDCSGLMGWALYNAGYDPGDIKGSDLLFELGEIHNSKEIIDSGKVKVGDFVHNNEATSHIGMIIGIDKEQEYYYVAQAIWYKPNGVCISKYNKKDFVNHWLQIALMDKYYKLDGLLTDMWY